MKVCVLAHTVYESDARVRREAECLAEHGAIVDVFCLNKNNKKKHELRQTIHIHRLLTKKKHKRKIFYFIHLGLFLFLSSVWITFYYFKRRYNFIHVHTIPDFLVFSAILPKHFNVPIILDMHEIMPELYQRKFNVNEDNIITKLLRLIERISIKFADHVIVASPIFAERIANRTGYGNKFSTIINLPDTKYFSNGVKRNFLRNQNFKIIYPGTLSELHGVDIVIKAIKIVRDEFNIPVEFHIFGSGNEKEELVDLTNTLRLGNTVKFHQTIPVEKLAHTLNSMDLGIVPKRKGVFSDIATSTKLFEYAAVGLPAIVSRTVGDSLYFDDSMVYFFEPENENALADGIVMLYENPQIRKELSKNSHEMSKRINWDHVKNDFLSVFSN